MTLDQVQQFHRNVPANIIEYLELRGITKDMTVEYKLGYGEQNGNYWISIPIFSAKGNLIVTKLRKCPFLDMNCPENTIPKYLFSPRGVGAEIFGYSSLIGAERLYICEGEFDCILLQSKGVNAITSTAGANTFRKEWITECLRGIQEFIIVFDRDKAGDAGANKLAQNILEFLDNIKVYKVTLPEEVGQGGDITDYFIYHNGIVSDLMNKYASKVMLNLASRNQNYLKPVMVKDFSGSFEDEIQAAKGYPMESLMDTKPLRTSDNIIFYLSPFREEKLASFAIYKDTNSWYDFGSGVGGDTIAYIQKIYNLDFKESVKWIITHS